MPFISAMTRRRYWRPPKRRMEFSKVILVAVALVALLVIIFACVMMWRTNDLSPLAYLIPGVLAELGVGTAFYYRKAETENKIKLRRWYGADTKESEE